MEVHVPHDVILNHILPRVPVKTVGRFRCVSKEWHSSLTWDMLRNMHIDHHQINGSKLLVISASETSFEFTTIDCEAPPSDKGLTPTRRPLPPFEGISTPRNICILASFHGLVCLGILKRNGNVYSHIILWNPLTNEYKRLSKSNSHKECNNIRYYYSDFGLYYSCCKDDYKLLFLNYGDNNVYIYSLKSDSWRKLGVFQYLSLRFPGTWRRGTYLNENLYFLQLSSRQCSIIRFDTKTERCLSRIDTPSVYGNTYDYSATIMVKSACIHVCVRYDIEISSFGRTTCIKLWKLDEYGNMKEVVTYQLRPHVDDHIISSLSPFHLTNNGNWLMIRDYWWSSNSCEHKIYKVDLKKKTRQINDKGNIYDDFEYAEVRVDDKNNNIVDVEGSYIETFVSPNRYMK